MHLLMERPNESDWMIEAGELAQLKMEDESLFNTVLDKYRSAWDEESFSFLENVVHTMGKEHYKVLKHTTMVEYDNLENQISVCMPENSTNHLFEEMRYWVTGIVSSHLVVIGVILNVIGIKILSERKPSSLFNYLLIGLLINESLYLVLTELQLIFTDHLNDRHIALVNFFTYFLLEARPWLLYASIYITVLMARQRYLAIQHPVEYRVAQLHCKPKKQAILTISAVLVLTLILCIPLFFEPMIVYDTHQIRSNINETHMILRNETSWKIMPAPLRLNLHHVTWYRSLADLLGSIIIPFGLLAYWNFNTASVLQRRQRMRFRPHPTLYSSPPHQQHHNNDPTNCEIEVSRISPHQQQQQQVNNNHQQGAVRSALIKADEARKAKVLFAIVFMVALSNIPRLIMSANEAVHIIPNYLNPDKDGKIPCYVLQDWTHLMNVLSNFMLVTNAASVTLIYSMMDRKFRQDFYNSKICWLFSCFKCVYKWVNARRHENSPLPPQSMALEDLANRNPDVESRISQIQS